MKNIKACWRGFSKQELIMELGKGFFLCYMIALLFYNQILLLGCYIILWYPWLYYRELQRNKKHKKEMLEELKEMLLSIHNSLYAGYSLENALNLARGDIRSGFGERENGLEHQLEKIHVGLGMNVPVEQLLKNMAQEVGLEEMNQFVKIVLIVKRKGGNLVEILGQTIDHLNQKIQVKEEIITLTSAKVLEQRIMSAMPFLIICYVRFTSPDYFETLYSNVAGWMISTISLCVLATAYVMGSKITEIEV
ncbi:MAG: hypothetical protein PHT76_06585 [Anaerostipes sp.]|nr:hypothetical protein [Anaerostipes sp.]